MNFASIHRNLFLFLLAENLHSDEQIQTKCTKSQLYAEMIIYFFYLVTIVVSQNKQICLINTVTGVITIVNNSAQYLESIAICCVCVSVFFSHWILFCWFIIAEEKSTIGHCFVTVAYKFDFKYLKSHTQQFIAKGSTFVVFFHFHILIIINLINIFRRRHHHRCRYVNEQKMFQFMCDNMCYRQKTVSFRLVRFTKQLFRLIL